MTALMNRRTLERLGISATVVLLLLALVPSTIHAQEPSAVQRAFESGNYQQVIDAAATSSDPAVLFLGALAGQKLNATEQVNAFLDQLIQRPAEDAWHFVGLAAKQLLANDDEAALNSARSAVTTNPNLPEAHSWLGLVLIKRPDWPGAAGQS